MKYSPVIVVVAFNRPKSLERLLFSLKQAKNIENAKLIISIDHDEPKTVLVKKIADDFIWPFGEKEVIYHNQRLGLRRHVLQCGDFAKTYGSVIILEDDLFVSPYFYDYTVQALSYYDNDERIGGISLFNPPREELYEKPFVPINDNSDVYFMQFPSSLGQAWTGKQWEHFREWYNNEPDISVIHLPDKVFTWPETSWKKYFCAFLVKFNKFVAFPKISLTTNFNDPGSNMKFNVNHEGQTQLKIGNSNFRFINLRDSYCIYDVYFEIMQEGLNKIIQGLDEYPYEMDLYGRKNIEKITKPYIITTRQIINPINSYKRALKPHEMNVIFKLKGTDIHLGKKEDVLPNQNKNARAISDYQYYVFRRLPRFTMLIYNYILRKIARFY